MNLDVTGQSAQISASLSNRKRGTRKKTVIEVRQKAEMDEYMRMMTNGKNSDQDDSTVQHTKASVRNGATPTNVRREAFEAPSVIQVVRSKTPIKEVSSKVMAVSGHRCTSEWHFDNNPKRQTISHSFLLDGEPSPNNGAHNVYDPITNDVKDDK